MNIKRHSALVLLTLMKYCLSGFLIYLDELALFDLFGVLELPVKYAFF